ncbi:MAG: efflux RND transporter periplasmic adaptor subunit [Gammaproteobacteria bacterium]|uniref:efflux RND transporter periplasmic adaptor subunit n=1 Tax=Rhodoferax sp. TaxID=50421 RepID=UPI0017FF84F1|nr:efflux RND transporter periplasmic adaptor subunit [Rhodoferax sp.]MBU3898772.1 efflux RND transporter periplasmic adaptor subunit [Gammaproteobacteria bacterium]MBA3058095.1 efflux RND transporter periplasmic adaptor subunit [Rhodoferax sp.]MBU3996538.1 efflux RND transporter periplasmic adaptor subunit [Gammaproteobacteria bacterium]MBU4017821.1 efflux RND transporter periplasmic adaptor subunit [Gammaproteobacteria bacterium]MBU4080755.1 efflux RND transporter periplasmic adaptor subunit
MIRRLLLALLVVCLLGAGIWWAKRPKPIAVTLTTIDQGRVEASVANTRAGTVEACLRTKLSATMGGRIEVLAVKEGDRVSKGQLLMKLWNDDQQAQSTLALAQVQTARQRVTEACTVAANAEREAQRQQSLFQQGFVSSSRAEQARTEAQAKRAGCDGAKADVAQAQARVNVTRVEQNRTVLYAPFAGTVAKIVGEVGEYATPSPPGVPTPPAIDLIDDSCLYVRAPMDEVDAPKISAGQTVRISFDALPKQSFPGTVKRVAPYVSALEKQARTVDIEATLDTDQTPPRLLVGYSADVEVILAVRDKVVRVPTSALQEGARVLVAGTDGNLQERSIKTGLANWEFTEVLEGLAVGDRVVTSLEREGVKAGAAYVLDDSSQK